MGEILGMELRQIPVSQHYWTQEVMYVAQKACWSSLRKEWGESAPLRSFREMQKVTSAHNSGSSGGMEDPSNKFPPFLLMPATMVFWALPTP